MINRRQFNRAIGAGVLGTFSLGNETLAKEPSSLSNETISPRPRMYVGTQKRTTDETLRLFQRCGVKNVCGYPKEWTVQSLLSLKQQHASYGITVDSVPSDVTRSVGLIGSQTKRDREIDQMCQEIRIAAKADIGMIQYNITVLNVLRTQDVIGRGDAHYLAWQFDKAPKNLPLTEAGNFPAELFWERITYFLERVIPVATEYKVKMACHPHDPGVPTTGYRGVQRVLGTVEGMKKFIEISPSPYHGFNFCIGTLSSNMLSPKEEIFDVIRYFGNLKKIFNVHIRNIRGRRDNFHETYIDEGDIDMFKVVKTLKEVGYSGMVMPDHVPEHPDDPGQFQGYAFTFGYIKALIQAVDSVYTHLS